ncbi:hypothetical protein PR048_009012 [Dryococelus australis]|uniref:Uncharacterized protein n=1 Tax=Dryococelus australis TaxID=614101 RepID=A0ABQ9HYQ3_9NEOP|nr:hypothetical protein PR048_009012 [Dryococelus australis]
MEVKSGEIGATPECKSGGKLEIPEKTHRPAALSGTCPTCENSGVARPGIEPCSPLWEASRLTAQPPRPRLTLLASHLGELGSIPGRVTPGFSLVGNVPGGAAGRQVFSGISRFILFAQYRTTTKTLHALSVGAMSHKARVFVSPVSLPRILILDAQIRTRESRPNFSQLNSARRLRWQALYLPSALAPHHGDPGSIPGGSTLGSSHVGRLAADFLGALPLPLPLHSSAAPSRVSPHVMLRDDGHLQVPAGKPEANREVCRKFHLHPALFRPDHTRHVQWRRFVTARGWIMEFAPYGSLVSGADSAAPRRNHRPISPSPLHGTMRLLPPIHPFWESRECRQRRDLLASQSSSRLLEFPIHLATSQECSFFDGGRLAECARAKRSVDDDRRLRDDGWRLRDDGE